MSLTTIYRTTDNVTHTSRRDANKHQAQLDTTAAVSDLVQANIPALSTGMANDVAKFIVLAAPAMMQALRQLKPQPLQDVTVLSELGLVAPTPRVEETAEETTADTPEENTAEDTPEVTVAEDPVQEQAAEPAAEEPVQEQAAEPVAAQVTFTSPPPAAEQAAPVAETTEEVRAPGSFF